jgi:hypothetical protein
MYVLFYCLYFKKFQSQFVDDWYCRIIVRLTNLFIPIYFKLLGWLPQNKLNSSRKQYIVSLTTFPARINNVWLAIESILRQKRKPDAIILWLSKEEFKDLTFLPKRLLTLQNRGLQIRFCPGNLMPHKKYLYAIKEFPDANIITIDDDMLYPPDLLEKLIKAHEEYPDAICCAITREVKTHNGKLMSYKEWDYVKTNTTPALRFLTMGGGGTLFPPNSLNPEVFNLVMLKKKALRTDDLWLKTMSLLSNTKVAAIGGEYPRFFIPIINKKNIRLMDLNIGEGQNDKVFNDLMEHYKIPVSIFEES